MKKIKRIFENSENINMQSVKNYLNVKNVIFVALAAVASLIFFSCKTLPQPEEPEKPEEPTAEPQEKEPVILSRRILDKGVLSAGQLAAFFLLNNPDETEEHITQFAQYYVDEAEAEGINSDVAFAQMCLETGYLRFGGLVQPEFHNYCGLGAMDAEHPGEQFETEQLGVRAHIQHLQAYATNEETQLNNELVDPRYNWVHKTKFIEDITGLTGTWAADPLYDQKIQDILSRMEVLVMDCVASYAYGVLISQ